MAGGGEGVRYPTPPSAKAVTSCFSNPAPDSLPIGWVSAAPIGTLTGQGGKGNAVLYRGGLGAVPCGPGRAAGTWCRRRGARWRCWWPLGRPPAGRSTGTATAEGRGPGQCVTYEKVQQKEHGFVLSHQTNITYP